MVSMNDEEKHTKMRRRKRWRRRTQRGKLINNLPVYGLFCDHFNFQAIILTYHHPLLKLTNSTTQETIISIQMFT